MERYNKNGFDSCRSFSIGQVTYEPPIATICLNEVKEVFYEAPISEDPWPAESSVLETNSEVIDLLNSVEEDLRSYIHLIACLYLSDNPFHNFEHACHVTMNVNKLLKRIVSCDSENNSHRLNHSLVISSDDDGNDNDSTSYIHSLCCDSLALFAIVFSALIHDVDHPGCSNARLAEENASLGSKYRHKCVAEQNSIDIAWNLLMDERFNRLRFVVFHNQNNLMRFRQILVNSVLATDISDNEINDLRRSRWNKAFSNDALEVDIESVNRKITIIVEHIIQASDVSHAMQHWHVYMKWNKLLFREMYLAYTVGRLKAKPQDFWYEEELGFFDNYIIPLANKLKECRVFGVLSDEYYNYAISNRNEWAATGQDKLVEMIQEINENLLVDDSEDSM